MNKTELVKEVAKRVDKPIAEVGQILNCFMDVVGDKMKEGESLSSLIEKAGGLLENADLDCFDIYYSLTILDTSIYIPKSNNGNKISINTADLDTLQILPGIGEATAQKIIDYRLENGDFMLIDHLKRVSGIKESTFSKIKDYITI